MMNIKQAKQEIVDTVQAYLLKNEYGEYAISEDSPETGTSSGCTGNRKDADHGTGGKRV